MTNFANVAFPAMLETDGTQHLACAVDIPETNGVGATASEALDDLVNSLENIIASRIDDYENVPIPGKAKKGQPVARLTGLVAVKVALYRLCFKRGWRASDLAKAMDVDRTIAARILDLNHQSRFDLIESAFAVFDIGLIMRTVPAKAA